MQCSCGGVDSASIRQAASCSECCAHVSSRTSPLEPRLAPERWLLDHLGMRFDLDRQRQFDLLCLAVLKVEHQLAPSASVWRGPPRHTQSPGELSRWPLAMHRGDELDRGVGEVTGRDAAPGNHSAAWRCDKAVGGLMSRRNKERVMGVASEPNIAEPPGGANFANRSVRLTACAGQRQPSTELRLGIRRRRHRPSARLRRRARI